MRIAYLDCASGVSGDMMLGALVDAGADLQAIQRGIDSLGLPSCRLAVAETNKHGFRALQLHVAHEPEHTHRHLSHIEALIRKSQLSEPQQHLALQVFRRLAEAEAKVHGTSLEKVHFHEVGAVDSIADIVGCAIAWNLLGVDRIVASPVPTGSGFIEIAHGRCAIPAPATAELLRGIPLAPSHVEGELTTPTGAALLATLADEFGPLPPMKIQTIGYGAGQRDYDHANLLRLIVGETTQDTVSTDHIVLLETNLDDCSGETVGDCVERLWQAGALDVAVIPLQMKKNRPGILLQVQCPAENAERLAQIVFRNTSTIGLRTSTVERMVLPRKTVIVTTPWGEIEGILADLPGGGQRFSPEYGSCRDIADKHQVTVQEVQQAARTAFGRGHR